MHEPHAANHTPYQRRALMMRPQSAGRSAGSQRVRGFKLRAPGGLARHADSPHARLLQPCVRSAVLSVVAQTSEVDSSSLLGTQPPLMVACRTESHAPTWAPAARACARTGLPGFPAFCYVSISQRKYRLDSRFDGEWRSWLGCCPLTRATMLRLACCAHTCNTTVNVDIRLQSSKSFHLKSCWPSSRHVWQHHDLLHVR